MEITFFIVLLCGSAIAMALITLFLNWHSDHRGRLLLRMIADIVLVFLIGSARAMHIAEPDSLRGLIGLSAVTLVLADLLWGLALYIKK